MLTFLLIISAELIILFRLALPDFLAWAEARHDAVYNVSDGDPRLATILNNPTIIEGE
jgi:hypothetical protein